MHDLRAELHALPVGEAAVRVRDLALRIEQGRVFSVRRELQVVLYGAVAMLVAGVGLLVKEHLDRIGPLALCAGILIAALLCYAVVLRAKHAGRQRSLGEDYVLLLAALLFSSAVAYAEVQFRLFGTGWSRHLLWLALWHLATAYWLGSRLVLAVALMAFAGWIGVEAKLGTVFDPLRPAFGAGWRALLCALLFWLGARLHAAQRGSRPEFRDVYLQFAAHFGFWGALALGAAAGTRWIGAIVLLGLALVVGRIGLLERRESFLLYAVGYATVGLVWFESLVVRDDVAASWIGLGLVIGAVVLLQRLRARLRESSP